MLGIVIVFGGAFLGGFVSVLAGFGTGLVGLGIWLHAVPPAPATSLVIICSVIAQCQTLPTIWHAVDLRRLWPMLAAGVVGVPIGARLLAEIDPQVFRMMVGALLMAFSAWMLIGRARFAVSWGGAAADAVVGLGGGVLGGLAGLSGPLPTVWATLRGWDKDRRRGVFQVFNLTVLSVALAAQAVEGLLTWRTGWLLLWAVPGSVLGAWFGGSVYRRLSDARFQQIVLGLLGASGIVLIWPGLFGK